MVVEVRSYSRISGQTSQDSEIATPGSCLGQDRAGAPLVRLVGEAVQEADGDRLDLLGLQLRRDAAHRLLVERQQHGAVGGHALGHAEAQVARHQRLRPLHVDVVLLEAMLPGHLERNRGSLPW